MSNMVLARIPTHPKNINKNMIRNGYFLDPVNQLNQSEYSRNYYQPITTIDSWDLSSNNGTASVQLTDFEGIKFQVDNVDEILNNPYSNFLHNVLSKEFQHYPNDKIYTISIVGNIKTCVLGYNNIWFTALSTQNGFGTRTFSIEEKNISSPLSIVFQLNNQGETSNIQAVKLEPGTEQTLVGYKNNNYELQIIDIPNKEEELRRCQNELYCLFAKDYNAGNNSIIGSFYCWQDGKGQLVVPIPVPFSTNEPKIYFRNLRFIYCGDINGSFAKMQIEIPELSNNIGFISVSKNNIIVSIKNESFRTGMTGWVDFMNLDGYFIASCNVVDTTNL